MEKPTHLPLDHAPKQTCLYLLSGCLQSHQERALSLSLEVLRVPEPGPSDMQLLWGRGGGADTVTKAESHAMQEGDQCGHLG